MKKMVFFLLCSWSAMRSQAQQNLGIRNSNYSGIQGSLLNPSSIADSKLKWDVNVLSGDVVFDNTFLFAPKGDLPLFGFKRVIKGSIDENLFRTRYDPMNPNKLYQLTLSTEILGPSFFMKIAGRHEIGFTMSARAYANVRDVTGNLGQNAFDYFLNGSLWNTALQDHSTRVNSMGWLQYGLHYATVIHREGVHEWKAGVSLNYLRGIAAAYAKNTNLNYEIGDTANLRFFNTSFDYGRTDYAGYKNANLLHDLGHGHGFGADIGVTYVHLKNADEGEGGPYLYRIGVSLIDIGAINFSKDAATYHLQADSANFAHWHQTTFPDNAQLDRALSAVFYQGDSTASFRGDHFRMGMPTAISVQADWNVCERFFANATIVKGFGHGGGQGVIRPDVYSLTPRYETEKFEVSLPMSLISYGHVRPRLGLAGRYRYFFIGGDAPGSLLKLHDLEGVDFYAGIHFYVPENKH
jgi:hypothetical protein